jgi:hypothetical protein
MNPNLADQFLAIVAKKSGFSYEQLSAEAKIADDYAGMARAELKQRLTR